MVRHTLAILVSALAAEACSGGEPKVRPARTETAADTAALWKIVPGGAKGALSRESSEASLTQAYGQAVAPSRIQIGEGETVPGTVLYESDSLRRLEIVWKDTLARQRPSRLILRGTRSLWQIGPGVSLGTSLAELERLNGWAFTLAGFGWDYGGVVLDWGGGILERSLPGVKLYLDPGQSQRESPAYSQVLGDREYSSSVAAMRQLEPRVYQIFVDFE